MLSFLHNNPLFASPEAELAKITWPNDLPSALLDNMWPLSGTSDQLAPTQQAQSGKVPVTHNLSFSGPVGDA